MRAVALAVYALCALACVPHAVPLEPAQRADAAARHRIGGFVLTPPAGRWIAEPVATGLALDCSSGTLRGFVSSLVVAEGEGTRVCEMTRVVWEIPDGKGNPRTGCLWLQPFSFAAGDPAAGSAREVAEALASRVHALRDDSVGEPDFWRGVKFQAGRGEARVLRIGANEFVDLHLVARAEPERVLRAGGRVLLLRAPHAPHLAAVVADAGIARDGESWRTLESFRPAAP